jgi:hypothetical protein
MTMIDRPVTRLPTVDPRAAPPLTIGPFTNVPAPGSPIRSDWPQTITSYLLAHAPTVQTSAGVAIAGGGPYDNIQTMTIAAVAVPRTVVLTSRLLVAFNGGSGWSVDMIAGVATIIATVTYAAADVTAGRQAEPVLTAVYSLAANQAGTFAVRSTGSANISGPGGTQYSLLVAQIFPGVGP